MGRLIAWTTCVEGYFYLPGCFTNNRKAMNGLERYGGLRAIV